MLSKAHKVTPLDMFNRTFSQFMHVRGSVLKNNFISSNRDRDMKLKDKEQYQKPCRKKESKHLPGYKMA